MRITVQCDSCFEEFTVRAERAGHRVACKHCGAVVRVPNEDAPVSSATLSRIGSGRSSRKRTTFGNPGLWIGIGIGGGAATLVAVLAMLLNRGGVEPARAPAASVSPAPPAETAARSIAATPARPDSSPVVTALPTPSTAVERPALATTAAVTSSTANASPAGEPASTATKVVVDAVADNSAVAKLAPLELPELIAQVEPAVVRINVRLSKGATQGSGFVVDTDGTVVTNYHVMEDSVSADVQFVDGSTAKVIGVRLAKPKHDICIIKIDAPAVKLRKMELASELPPKGTSAVAFGAPLGLSFSSSEGIISGLRSSQELGEELGALVDGRWLQTTCSISPGSSGGPLMDRRGRVIGMNTMTLAVGQSLNFAVSSLDIAAALREAPSIVKPLNLAKLKPVKKTIDRTGAASEIGTPRGQKLFSEVKEIFLLNVTKVGSAKLDPTGRIWDRVIARSEVVVERAKLPLSFGVPSDEAAVMLVSWELKPSRKGTTGTQELHIKAVLVCYDLAAKQNVSPFVKVWEVEDMVGTIALQALATGQFPRTADEKLAQFFTKFHSAYLKSVRETENGAANKPVEKKAP
jgi:S1-C subfamily serine protease